jgi:hypothetical protein
VVPPAAEGKVKEAKEHSEVEVKVKVLTALPVSKFSPTLHPYSRPSFSRPGASAYDHEDDHNATVRLRA